MLYGLNDLTTPISSLTPEAVLATTSVIADIGATAPQASDEAPVET